MNRQAGIAGALLPGLVIVGAATTFAGLFVLNLGNAWAYTDSVSAILYHYVLPAAAAVVLLSGFLLTRENRQVLAICVVMVVPALYAMEGYLWYRYFHRLDPVGADFDRRSKLQVIADLRQEGARAYPSMRATSMLAEDESGALVSVLDTGTGKILPLANLPGRTIVACNETGRRMVFESDEFGFNNPPGRWVPAPGKIALVGDSFTEGDCLPRQHNIAAHLSRKSLDALNLGTSGFGPLSQLASLKEYLPTIRPEIVLWMFFEGNDVTRDLTTEKRSPILRNYLRPEFTQDLVAGREDIMLLFERYLDAEMETAVARVSHPFEEVLDFLQLWRLRETFGLDMIGLGVVGDNIDGNLALFEEVLGEARRSAESWGGQLVFVYLPDGPRYFASARDSRIRDRIRDRVLAIAEKIYLPVIDVHPAFSAHPDPKTLFVYAGSHYNADGYALAADAVFRGLQSLARSSSATARRISATVSSRP